MLISLILFVGAHSFLRAEQAVVVCVHGVMRSSASMSYAACSLRKAGYHVENWGYPSRMKTITEHGEDLAREIKRVSQLYPGRPIHFVTHSMGGLVLRVALNHPECPEVAKKGKAVLYAPPNRGSSFGRKMSAYSFVRQVYGEYSGAELLFTEEDGFEKLGSFPESLDVMVIAGTQSFNPLVSEESDGTVRVAETALKTPFKWETFPVNHTFIMWSPRVLRATVNFLKAPK